MTQVQLAHATGLSPASVSNIVHELLDVNRVEVLPTTSSGRAANLVRLVADDRVVVGVDVDHARVRVAVADANRVVLSEVSSPLIEGHEVANDLELALTMARQAMKEAGFEWDQLAGVSLAVPAPIDSNTGLLGSSSILPGWAHVAVGGELQRRIGVPVLVENNANLGAWGEYVSGNGRGAKSLVYLTIGAGIGSGFVLDGRLFRGAAGLAGEIGHIAVDERGPLCRCGNRGCLESFASGPILLQTLGNSHPDLTGVPDMVQRALKGDLGVQRVISDAGRAVGMAVANLCNVLNPDRIVVGGDIAEAGEIFLSPLREAVARFSVPRTVSDDLIVRAGLGTRSELVGAIDLAVARLTAVAP